ncbi:hypothetical protein PR048_023328 [Dryococelus australis]|uniref:Uncharacterized protein n=1 Tax=Dryococelus australis TaxID=614101 RepID=A0ABQ9GTV8_9NEOP|nr:hypothetical protein PR048_023328 [Dryococelus australis]
MLRPILSRDDLAHILQAALERLTEKISAQRRNGLANPATTREIPGVSSQGATVAKRLARSPPTKVNRVQPPAGSPGGADGSRVFSGSPVPPPLHSGAAPYSLQSPSSALTTSLQRDRSTSSLVYGVTRGPGSSICVGEDRRQRGIAPCHAHTTGGYRVGSSRPERAAPRLLYHIYTSAVVIPPLAAGAVCAFDRATRDSGALTLDRQKQHVVEQTLSRTVKFPQPCKGLDSEPFANDGREESERVVLFCVLVRRDGKGGGGGRLQTRDRAIAQALRGRQPQRQFRNASSARRARSTPLFVRQFAPSRFASLDPDPYLHTACRQYVAAPTFLGKTSVYITPSSRYYSTRDIIFPECLFAEIRVNIQTTNVKTRRTDFQL